MNFRILCLSHKQLFLPTCLDIFSPHQETFIVPVDCFLHQKCLHSAVEGHFLLSLSFWKYVRIPVDNDDENLGDKNPVWTNLLELRRRPQAYPYRKVKSEGGGLPNKRHIFAWKRLIFENFSQLWRSAAHPSPWLVLLWKRPIHPVSFFFAGNGHSIRDRRSRVQEDYDGYVKRQQNASDHLR